MVGWHGLFLRRHTLLAAQGGLSASFATASQKTATLSSLARILILALASDAPEAAPPSSLHNDPAQVELL